MRVIKTAEIGSICNLQVERDVDLATVCENPKELTFASCCRKMRWISNCFLRICYDTSYHFCKKEKGCKKKTR